MNLAAYSSGTDIDDETHSAGLHIVVGRLYQEPMETHVEAVVDGRRFALRFEDVVEGYEARSLDVPDAWIDKVAIEASTWTSSWSTTSSSSSSWSSGSWSSYGWANGADASDEDPTQPRGEERR